MEAVRSRKSARLTDASRSARGPRRTRMAKSDRIGQSGAGGLRLGASSWRTANSSCLTTPELQAAKFSVPQFFMHRSLLLPFRSGIPCGSAQLKKLGKAWSSYFGPPGAEARQICDTNDTTSNSPLTLQASNYNATPAMPACLSKIDSFLQVAS